MIACILYQVLSIDIEVNYGLLFLIDPFALFVLLLKPLLWDYKSSALNKRENINLMRNNRRQTSCSPARDLNQSAPYRNVGRRALLSPCPEYIVIENQRKIQGGRKQNSYDQTQYPSLYHPQQGIRKEEARQPRPQDERNEEEFMTPENQQPHEQPNNMFGEIKSNFGQDSIFLKPEKSQTYERNWFEQSSAYLDGRSPNSFLQSWNEQENIVQKDNQPDDNPLPSQNLPSRRSLQTQKKDKISAEKPQKQPKPTKKKERESHSSFSQILTPKRDGSYSSGSEDLQFQKFQPYPKQSSEGMDSQNCQKSKRISLFQPEKKPQKGCTQAYPSPADHYFKYFREEKESTEQFLKILNNLPQSFIVPQDFVTFYKDYHHFIKTKGDKIQCSSNKSRSLKQINEGFSYNDYIRMINFRDEPTKLHKTFKRIFCQHLLYFLNFKYDQCVERQVQSENRIYYNKVKTSIVSLIIVKLYLSENN